MFRKEGSSCFTEKKNKKSGKQQPIQADSKPTTSRAIDVALRKSDVRNLRKRVEDFFNRYNTTTTSTTGDNDNDNNNSNAKFSTILGILDIAFVTGKIHSRNLHHAELGNLTLFLRTPDDEGDMNNNNNTSSCADNSDSNFEFSWPYHTAQVLWIEQENNMGAGGGKKNKANNNTVALPTLALLSLLPPLSMPCVFVPSMVSKYMCRGAHLMKAGMLNLPFIPQEEQHQQQPQSQNKKIKNSKQSLLDSDKDKREIVAVCVRGNMQPMAVGQLALNINDVNDIGPDTKGIGVHIWTCYGDDMWSQQRSKSSSTMTIPKSTAVKDVINPIGGASYNNGHYGNVAFHEGEFVSSIDKQQQQEDDNDNIIEEDDEVQEQSQNGDEEKGESSEGEKVPDQEKEAEQTLDNTQDEQDDQVKGEKSTEEDVHNSSSPEEAEEENDTTENSCDTNNVESNNAEDSQDNSQLEQQDDEDNSSSPAITQEEMLHDAVCIGLLNLTNSNLPMKVATFYAQYVLPNHKEGVTIDIKQTKYKKFSYYLKEQVRDNLLFLGPDKNNTNNKDPIACITRINRKHEDLISMKEKLDTTKDKNTNNKNSNEKKKLILVQLYIIPKHIRNLLNLDEDDANATNASSKERQGTGMLTMTEVRNILDKYLQREALIDNLKPNYIILNGPLHDTFYKYNKKNKNKNNEDKNVDTHGSINNSTTMLRKDAIDLWVEVMELGYCLVEMPGSIVRKLGRGNIPKVTIEVSLRQSNKFLTRVYGLEEYDIDVDYFSKDVSKRFACSSTIDVSTANKKFKEVNIQGNLASELEALLLGNESLSSHGGAKGSNYCLPKNSIDVILRKGVPARKKNSNNQQPKKKKATTTTASKK